eukprot:1700338-Prymnesium_polylepis.1
MRTCTCPSRGQSSEAIIYSVTQIAFFVNRPGKGGNVALIRRYSGNLTQNEMLIGFSDEESAGRQLFVGLRRRVPAAPTLTTG